MKHKFRTIISVLLCLILSFSFSLINCFAGYTPKKNYEQMTRKEGWTYVDEEDYVQGDKVVYYNNSTKKVGFSDSFENIVNETNSTTYNPKLAKLLMAFSASAYSQSDIAKSLISFDFNTGNIIQGTGYETSINFSTAYTIALTRDSNNDLLVCVFIRGTKDATEWLSDLYFATDINGLHQGFEIASNDLLKKIKSTFGDTLPTSQVKYIITGHSRGAAVGNILAYKLLNAGVKTSDVFNYNFACPDTVKTTIFDPNVHSGLYDCIFNISNANDIISYLPGNILSIHGKWDKFGKSYWFKENGDSTEIAIGGSAHSKVKYVSYLSKEKELSSYNTLSDIKSWSENSFSWNTAQKMVLVGVFCPVSVEIVDADGNVVAKVVDGELTGTAKETCDAIYGTDGETKQFLFSMNSDYYIRIIGTEDGTMNYSLTYLDIFSDTISDSVEYKNVVISKDKTFESFLNTDINKSKLYLVEENQYTKSINYDGTESKATYFVDPKINGNGSVVGAGEYEIGEKITLTAIPDKDYVFECWESNSFSAIKNNEYYYCDDREVEFVVSPKMKIYANFDVLKVNITNYSEILHVSYLSDVRLTAKLNTSDLKDKNISYSWYDTNGNEITSSSKYSVNKANNYIYLSKLKESVSLCVVAHDEDGTELCRSAVERIEVENSFIQKIKGFFMYIFENIDRWISTLFYSFS